MSEKAEQIISRVEKMRMDSGETTDTLFPFPVEQLEEEVPYVSQPTLPPMTALQRQFSEFPLDQVLHDYLCLYRHQTYRVRVRVRVSCVVKNYSLCVLSIVYAYIGTRWLLLGGQRL